MRLSRLRERALRTASACAPEVPVTSIIEVEEDVECVVVGTLYKQMQLKPDILAQYDGSKKPEAAAGADGEPSNFCHSGDSLVLEDESARMPLRGAAETPGALRVGELVTGAVVAVRGRRNDKGGAFEVCDLYFPGLPPQALPPPMPEDKFVALVSGLEVRSVEGDPAALQLQLLCDYLTGHLDAEGGLVRRIAHVVVCGNSVSAASGNASQVDSAAALRDLDRFLTQLSAALPVDLMPGALDPSNISLPQQPFHSCLLPSAGRATAFCRATNPHLCEVDGLQLLATSGQNVDDLAAYSELPRNTAGAEGEAPAGGAEDAGEHRVALMSRLLQMGHLAPTAPDTLGCYPYWQEEPFVLEQSPHILVAGNQPGFGAGWVQGTEGQGVRVIAVPSFRASGTIVLVNLRDRSCHPVTLDLQL